MKNKVLFAAVAILFLAAACNKGGNPPKNSGDQKPEAAEQSAKGQSSFKDLMAMGKPLKCDATFTMKDTTSTGTIYVASGKMFGVFTAQVQGKTMQTHMIVVNQTVYTWIEGLGTTMAFKT